MKQLNSYRFYELGAKLHSLFGAEGGGRIAEMFVPLSEAQTMLDGFIKGDAVALSTSKSDAVKLLNKIGSIFNRYFIDPSTKQLKSQEGEDRIDTHELATLRGLVEKFEHALAAELNRAPTYVAGKRGIYSTYDLAENAQEIFSESLRTAIPVMAQNEFAAAGRSLAFGLGTAAVMHTLRAVEMTLRSYYEVFAGAAPAKSERNYSVYIKKLSAMADEDDREPRPDKRVIQMLAQIKEHYRNPLIASEIAVSIDEATQLFGMASALISLMAEVIVASRRGSAEAALAAVGAVEGEGEEEARYDIRAKEGK
ncbi:MAG: hypothetical protein P4M13_05750 [Alphaproteobacteria bacterium]|nr:hypothetical protein [Alphaproteobacteria bacterium]